jgi:dihydrofolate reductase
MVEIVYGVAASLDGFIASPDGKLDWLAPFAAAGSDHFAEFMNSVDAVLVGSRTYEEMLPMGGGKSFGKPCYVFSSRKIVSDGPTVTITNSSPEEVVADLERSGVRRAWHFGGTKLFTSFRDAGLITEYSLGIIPVILGGGKPLFESPGAAAKLSLLEAKPHPSGALMVRYRVVAG